MVAVCIGQWPYFRLGDISAQDVWKCNEHIVCVPEDLRLFSIFVSLDK